MRDLVHDHLRDKTTSCCPPTTLSLPNTTHTTCTSPYLTSMLFAAILLLLLPLALFQHTVAATHAVCSWQPDRSPSNAGLVLHCTAEYIGDLPTSGHYECPKSKQVVATWSHIRAGILNFGEFCAYDRPVRPSNLPLTL